MVTKSREATADQPLEDYIEQYIRYIQLQLGQRNRIHTNGYAELSDHEITRIVAGIEIAHSNHARVPASRVVLVDMLTRELAQVILELGRWIER